MVTADRRIKVLDFGLAKPTGALETESPQSELPTQAKTAEGAIVGTVYYMSPEQAQGLTLDSRSDIFALGVLFYEMLIGRRPFNGSNSVEVISSIVKDEPRDLSENRHDVPRELAQLVKRCLAKEPDRRHQTAIDVRNQLEEMKRDAEAGSRRPVTARPMALLAMVGLLGVLLIGALAYRLAPVDRQVMRFSGPVQVTRATGAEDYPRGLRMDRGSPTSHGKAATAISGWFRRTVANH